MAVIVWYLLAFNVLGATNGFYQNFEGGLWIEERFLMYFLL